ncbi:Smr/MutS family protein [Magnetospirillum fulvum]|uniref:Smr domain-containing protein n=1 Tax=Magnetospirillum fulvum MGU-K5 TaxID=1316936 RepID=S9TRN1_MAGFU|nr:Smr/MutS family protein [Magnetospirillum fulvum]EPY01195.1 hypothetical protein K678_12092 [Magnetospirillum fulvum MGU-K5]
MKLFEPRQPRRRPVTTDEVHLWQNVVGDVRPLPGRARPDPATAAPVPTPVASAPPPPGTAPARPSNPPPPPRRPSGGLPALDHGHAPGLDRRTAERMKRGELAIEAVLDLHGHIQDRAHAELHSFIDRAWAAGRRLVLVVTGKGQGGDGVLRRQVPRWLNQSPLRERVIGFSHARQHHGGEGALYVLVRRRRDTR